MIDLVRNELNAARDGKIVKCCELVIRERGGNTVPGVFKSEAQGLAFIRSRVAKGTVVNADSMQVYRDLRIVTARPTAHEEARVPHRLYGHIDAAENYSVGRWLADVKPALDAIRSEASVPIFVGGTGLYFKALTQGLSAVPPIPSETRTRVRARLDAEGPAALHAELLARDPSSRIRPGDRMRIARALEVLEATGRPITDWHREGLPPLIEASVE